MDWLKTRPHVPKKATMSDKVHLTLASALTGVGLYVLVSFHAAFHSGLANATLFTIVAAVTAGGATGVLAFGRRIIRSCLHHG
jgi:hypothetical protein